MRLWTPLALLVTVVGCGKPPVAIVDPATTPAARLVRADELLQQGCLDCLLDARQIYGALKGQPEVAVAATASEIKTLVLIAMRQDDLGLMPGGALTEARRLAAAAGLAAALAPFLDYGDIFASAGPSGANNLLSDAALGARARLLRDKAETTLTALRALVPGDLAATSLWYAQACALAIRDLPERDARQEVVGRAGETPLLQFRRALGCPASDRALTERLLAEDPRFAEMHYLLGLRELAGQLRIGSGGRPDAEAAEASFRRAFAWRQDWPSLTLTMANVALTAEDFEPALDFYARTVALVASHPAAMLGEIRSLTYLGRYQLAIDAADRMAAAGRNPGDALYWRAYNRAQLEQHDAAWDDIERAETLLVNADVPKLAGIIAINRRDYASARARLELAIERRAGGCDAQFYLQAVLSEQRDWQRAATRADETASCLTGELARLDREIEEIRAGDEPEYRKARLLARRQQERQGDERMRSNAWFNAAVASFNLSKPEDARRYALLAAEDPRFEARARQILERLR